MNTNFLKKVSMPVAAAILGIAGAFTTTSMSSSKVLIPWQGHQYISQTEPCKSVKMCQTESNNFLCRVNDAVPTSPQLKGKYEITDDQCPLTLYRKVP